MDSPVHNRKIQHWITNIHHYNCLPHRPPVSNDDNECGDPDIADKMFVVSMINSSNINPKTFAQYDHQITNIQCTKEELNFPSYYSVAELTRIKKY